MAPYSLTDLALFGFVYNPRPELSSDFAIWLEAAWDSQISVEEPTLELLTLNISHTLLHLKYDLWGAKLDAAGARKEITKDMPIDKIS